MILSNRLFRQGDRLSDGSPDPSERARDQWSQFAADPLISKHKDRATAFHYIYGTSYFLLGKILEADPTLAKEGEPVNTPAFYLAAIDVFESGESLAHSTVTSDERLTREDWRLAINWGRTLVCLADEKLRRLSQRRGKAAFTSAMNFQDDLWPKDSAFASSPSKRPLLARRVSLPSMTPHEVLLQASDQFSRGLLHMPRHRKNPSHHAHGRRQSLDCQKPEDEEIDAPPTLPGLQIQSEKDIRPCILYTIASDILDVVEPMSEPSRKEYWANWADGIFNQMEMEQKSAHIEPDQEQSSKEWSYYIAIGRGRCWLVVGSTRLEVLEDRLGEDEMVLESDAAKSARSALSRGESFDHTV